MAEIRINPELVHQRASECRAHKGEMEGLLSKLRQTIQTMQSEWTGNASNRAQEAFGELDPAMRRTFELIDEFAQRLDEAANAFTQVDG